MYDDYFCHDNIHRAVRQRSCLVKADIEIVLTNKTFIE